MPRGLLSLGKRRQVKMLHPALLCVLSCPLCAPQGCQGAASSLPSPTEWEEVLLKCEK